MDNTEWTNGFWTGILWLAYEYTKDNKYKELAEKNVESFYNRSEQVAPLDFQEARAAISKYLRVDLSDKIKIKTEVSNE